MSILIIGANGSMGKRYQAILNYLKKDFACVDKDDDRNNIHTLARQADGIIIASPTETHTKYLDDFWNVGQEILCEAPISKKKEEIDYIRNAVSQTRKRFTVTMQYKMLDSSHFSGHTYCNYFNHGNNGLYWDSIQPIGLARSTIEISDTSPVWKCRLNGKRLSLGHMDMAYVEFIRSWLNRDSRKHIDMNEIINMHFKVMELEKNGKTNQSLNRDSGQK